MMKLLPLFILLTLSSFSIEVGNDPNGGGSVDGWTSIMVIDESSTYTNSSGADQTITPTGFDFQVGNNRGRVTPFLVKVNGDNDFTVVAIGETRVSGTDYSTTGVFEFDFGTNPPPIILADGEILAVGMTNANPDGSSNAGSVIPYSNSANEIWLTGGASTSSTGSVTLNNNPSAGSNTLNLNRTYAYSIDIDVQAAANQPPINLIFIGGNPLPGMPIGSTLGTLKALDPTPDDTHTYSFVTNPGSLYTIDGDQLKTNSPPGATGTSTTVRIKAIDEAANKIERDFILTVEAQSPPTDITLDADSVSSLVATGSPVAQISTVDTNPADQFTYSLVSGSGDTHNSLFSITNNILSITSPIPNGQSSLTFRIRTTDLGNQSFEKSITLPISLPSILINEFSASNNSLLDEDGDSPDWIELYNNGNSCVDLANWTITDNTSQPSKWTFPPTVIAPGEFLILFASGKDRAITGAQLHTNFSLSSNGETLTLYGPGAQNIAHQILSPPAQFPNISYGLNSNQTSLGYLTPTPNLANGTSFTQASSEVTFDKIRGSYPSAFNLTLSASPGAQIRYTTNGSAPTSSSTLYSTPISVSPSTLGSTNGLRTIRAATFGANSLLNPVATHTYLFANQAASQSTLNSTITSDPTYGPLISASLTSQPIISVTRPAGLPNGTESVASLEFFDPALPSDHFQIDCGIKIVGGHSVSSPKNNFRLYFRNQYGTSDLNYPLFENSPFTNTAVDSFDRLNLRSSSHDSFFWLANPNNPSQSGGPVKGDAQYLRNRWMLDMQFQMGQPSLRGRWVQLFINGNYRGQYHLLEHPNQDYQADHFGGDPDDYAFTNGANGSKTGSDNWQTTWAKVKTASNGDATTAASWIDLENLADYMILNFYAGNPWDWNPNQNWWTAGPVNPDQGGWKFYSWDADIIFQDPNANVLNKNVPDGVFSNLINDPDFAIIFRDRLYHHCFHNGLLSPSSTQSLFDTLASKIELSIVAETARWQSAAANPPWDRNDEWETELNRMRTTFFPARCQNLLNQIKAKGWYPVETPEYDQRGGSVTTGHQPILSAPAGNIYFTTDGSDPRLPGGALSPSATLYTPGIISLNTATLVRTRARNGTNWSAINDAPFIISGTLPANLTNLAITEIHYHPSDPTPAEVTAGFTTSDGFEFIELTNFSSGPIDLTNVSFTKGITFTFPPATTLSPGQRIIVVKNTAAFLSRHPGLSSSVAGEFLSTSGNPSEEALSNGGEQITLIAADLSTIADFTYNDKLPWPTGPDGDGFSLVLRSTALSPADPESWRSSSSQNGNPASTDTTPLPPGTSLPSYVLANPTPSFSFTSTGKIEIIYQLNLTADDASIILQKSPDLETWTDATGYLIDDQENLGNGIISTEFQSPNSVADSKLFFRLKITAP